MTLFVVLSLPIGLHPDDVAAMRLLPDLSYGALWTLPFKESFYRPLTVTLAKVSTDAFGVVAWPLRWLRRLEQHLERRHRDRAHSAREQRERAARENSAREQRERTARESTLRSRPIDAAMARSGYLEVVHRRTLLALIAMVGTGCATLPEPSAPDARRASDDSVSRDNPGGDAAQPVDAALERLLSEPLATHVDYWKTLSVPLPDRKHWKGTRFKRYPTRAAYQYGKSYIGLAVIAYTNAEGDAATGGRAGSGDDLEGCMQPLLDEARGAAKAYGIELGAMHREVKRYRRGPEAVDWRARASQSAADDSAADNSSADNSAADESAAKARMSERDGDERAKAVRALQDAQPHAHVSMPDTLPTGEMLVLRTSGKLNTLFKRDQYVGAFVAYPSWPGTCLVQGFAVRVGSDVMLARRVVTRWVEDAAPTLRWASWLRSPPPRKNR